MSRSHPVRRALATAPLVALAALGLVACDPLPDAPRARVPQIISTAPAEVDPALYAGAARPSPSIEEVAVGLDGRTVRVVWTGAPLACEGPSRMRFQVVEREAAKGGDWLLVSLDVRAAEPATCDGEPARYSTTDRIPDELVVTDGMEVVGALDADG
jgi:hypothetical protein